MDSNYIFVNKPYCMYSSDERKNFWDAIKSALEKGKGIIVLGNKRCFICGVELGNSISSQKRGPGMPRVIVNLCHKCKLQSDIFEARS